MEMPGRVDHGVIVLEGGESLPEGTKVLVRVPVPNGNEPGIECVPGELPVVHTGGPGTLHLTNDMIAEILDEDDIDRVKGHLNVPS